ncbi:MAG: HAMP domain-containing histidine kinase [Bacteroidales bacterium]|nr:HAMP domain-containing histidine kinase [Bacteroidales bacterium]
MRTSTVKIIIFISSLALVGLVFTQTFWMREEIEIARKQFDHRADRALMGIVDELSDHVYNSSRFFPKAYACAYLGDSKEVLEALDTMLLQTLVDKYVAYHHLDDDYFYAIVKTTNDSMIYKSAGFPAFNAPADPYKAYLTNIWKDVHYHIALYFPHKNRVIVLKQVLWLGITLLFLVIIIFGVAAIIITYLRQKKLSEMKNDFVNNITHEFKTPVSTIALAAEVLHRNEAKNNPEKIRNYARIILDENERMKQQIERVLEIAQQDHRKIKLEPVQLDVHELLQSIASDLCFRKSEKEININFQLNAVNHVIKADLIYIKGIICNIVENAIKYSSENPELTITTEDFREGILMSFADNGIGMSRESLKMIFEKFYRVPTGNVHNVKGFGLGLYLAKTMTQAHGGHIKVSSEINKGSRFDVYLPSHINNKNY